VLFRRQKSSRATHVLTSQKYIMPHLQPPSEDAFEATSSQLTTQFDEAAALLKQIQEDTVAAHNAVQEQQKAVDSAVEEVKNVMGELKNGEERSQNEMREIRSEVDNIREMLPKVSYMYTRHPGTLLTR
jgi:peroxin-14